MDQENNQNKKEYKFYLPNDGEQITQTNSIIIVGGNGAGKSHLGAWIEERLGEKCHRISGQRNLLFENNQLVIRSKELALNKLEFNYEDAKSNVQHYMHNKFQRWNYGNHKTTTLLNDFSDALSAFISLESSENQFVLEEARKLSELECGKAIKGYLNLTKKMQNVWEKIFPQRNILIDKYQFFAQKSGGEKYLATEMSDGERAVLYLIAQVLSIREGKTIIIDEPELHLHPSIMNKLWLALEEYRPDCLFIYITHDIEFASLHQDSKKVWVKSFNIENNVKKWEYEELKHQDSFPEDLLLEILGGRKNVLFVEGEKQSYDTQLYQKLYPEFFVIPCEGCEKVIERVKSLNEIEIFNKTYKAYGIIDRDFRTEHELECLKQDRIFALSVAEIENLFLIEEIVLWVIKKYLDNKDASKLLLEIKNYIINIKYANQKTAQIQEAIKCEILYELKKIDLNKKELLEVPKLKEEITSQVEKIDFDGIIQRIEEKFKTDDYFTILKIFNQKDLILGVCDKFGWKKNKKEYIDKILVNLDKDEGLMKIFSKFIPILE